MKKYNIYLVLAIVAFVAATWLAFGPQGNGQQQAMAETAATDFTLNGVDGNPVSLADYKGKVVVLNFWATWCPPCREEIPHFVELYKEHKDDGLVILGLSVDRGGPDIVIKWLGDNPVNYPIAMSSQEVTQQYQQFIDPDQRGGIPFTFVIGRDGEIKHALVGYRDKAQWEELVLPLLKQE